MSNTRVTWEWLLETDFPDPIPDLCTESSGRNLGFWIFRSTLSNFYAQAKYRKFLWPEQLTPGQNSKLEIHWLGPLITSLLSLLQHTYANIMPASIPEVLPCAVFCTKYSMDIISPNGNNNLLGWILVYPGLQRRKTEALCNLPEFTQYVSGCWFKPGCLLAAGCYLLHCSILASGKKETHDNSWNGKLRSFVDHWLSYYLNSFPWLKLKLKSKNSFPYTNIT